jgi:hypothetical protein
VLLEVLLICSLTHTYPFYDCSEQWTIEVYSEPVPCFVGHEIMAAGCTNFETKTIKIYDYAMHQYDKDRYGFTVLEHELEHLKCMCDFHS